MIISFNSPFVRAAKNSHNKTRRQFLAGQPTGKAVTTRFIWEGFRLLQEIHDGVPLTCVYSDPHSYEPLARIDGTQVPDIYWFHNQPNGTPERLTDVEGRLRWEGRNSAWGKLAHESTPLPTGYHQNLRMQGQYLDRETGLHYNLFRYYDPDCGRFTQHDPIGLAGGINLYQFAPNALGWLDPWGLSCKTVDEGPVLGPHGSLKNDPRPGQSHHLNQDAAFRDIIPTNSGAAIKLEGNAFTQPGTPHYEAHKSLEKFWDQFRRGGIFYRETPTNLQYTQALKHSLEAAGLSANKVKQAIKYSIQNRIQHGALGGMNVPRIPGRINQVKL
ncbi:RHS domain-containing protein [Cronobacter sakazakii]|nr:RHS domain-containing protein [Cronobacter sakazakii]